jgi:nucleoside-diphosphate-sugar epimerase
MKIVVTGATGYIGSRLTYLALKNGHDVIVASRQRPSSFAGSWLSFDLLSDNWFALPSGVDAVVHLAANISHAHCLEDEREVVAAQKLIESAQEAGARFIFVSSQTARSVAPTAYGRMKWRIELEVLSAGGWVVRPGQVYGGELRGLFGTLTKSVKHLPVLPAFAPAPMVQPIHVDDLAEGLLNIAEQGDIPPGVYCLAAPAPVSFSKFLDGIAKSRLRCRRGFVPVPVVVINALSTVLGEALQTRLGLERLGSLFDLPVMDTASNLKQLGLTLRPLRSGLHPSGSERRRCLLQEGRALFIYVLKEPPGSAVLRRYIRAIERMRGGQALGLPQVVLSYPIFLSLLDASVWADKTTSAEFSWRLDAATVLAEATLSGAHRFLGCRQGVLISLLSVAGAMACEVFWRVIRALLSPLVRLALCRARGSV